MEYMVVGIDGKEYGPSTIDTLRQWASENRIQADTKLKNFMTGQTVKASDVPGIFINASPAPTMPPVQSPYVRPNSAYGALPPSQTKGDNEGLSDVLWAIFRAILAVVVFYYLHGFGIIIAIYGIVYAVKAQEKGHRLAPWRLVFPLSA